MHQLAGVRQGSLLSAPVPVVFETRGNTRSVCWVTYPETAIFKTFKIFHLVTLVMKSEKGRKLKVVIIYETLQKYNLGKGIVNYT